METPDAILHGFMKEMHSWEKRCAARRQRCISGSMTFDEATEVGQAEYMAIYHRYCSGPKGQPRDFFYTEPPDYDPDREVIRKVLNESPDLVEIHTQQEYGHQKRHVFRLVLENGEWRLIDRQILIDNGKMIASTL